MQAAPDSFGLPLHNRLLAVALVVMAHALLAWSWASLPELPKQVKREMLVSVTLPEPPPPEPVPPPPEPEIKPPEVKPLAKPKPKPVEPQQVQPVPEAVPVAEPAPEVVEDTSPVEPVVASEPPQPVAAQPSLPDRDPDYQAAYLNNPPPPYPMTARRMGWQGRVVLNVEVLASGLPGKIELQQSSGHAVLDNAAIKAVSGWKFVPARQGGQNVSKRFLVPIPFILKEAE